MKILGYLFNYKIILVIDYYCKLIVKKLSKRYFFLLNLKIID